MIDCIQKLLANLRKALSRPENGEPRRYADHVYDTLECMDGSNRLHECTLGWSNEPNGYVNVTVPDLNVHVSVEGFDVFDAFLLARKQLEKKGLRLVCAGTRKDCWPSGMARQMGAGETAYLLIPGKTPDPEERVYLFAQTDPDKVSTVADQEASYRRWLESLPGQGDC